ncbi:MAG: sigma-54 dependent transcriptional regulator [Gemmatales bacterium]
MSQIILPPPASLQHRQRLLVVEDSPDTRESLQELLQLSLQIEVDVAENGLAALKMLEVQPYSVVLTDLRMPRMNGMKLIEEIQARKLNVTIIVTTGHGSIQDAVIAMRMGAYDFITKPPDPQHLCLMIKRALEERALRDEVVALKEQIQNNHSFKNVLSKNPRMHEIFDLIGHMASTTTTVLIQGETGTGKEQLALAIHEASGQHRTGPFVAINCAAIPETLLESELFGHEKGSFTGAGTQRKGRFEMAHGGTLFLDEVGDIPPMMQIKLLRVLQERKFERIGGSETIESNFRLIAATNQPLAALVNRGKFREDLYYRLNVVQIELPPLRERPEDIALLTSHFVQKFSKAGQKPAQVEPEAMEALINHNWPGNIRQLENVIERACITATEGIISVKHVALESRANAKERGQFRVDVTRPLPEQLTVMIADVEKRYLRRMLKRTQGHVGSCAKLSGLSRRSITDKIAEYGIDKSEFKQD